MNDLLLRFEIHYVSYNDIVLSDFGSGFGQYIFQVVGGDTNELARLRQGTDGQRRAQVEVLNVIVNDIFRDWCWKKALYYAVNPY